MRDTEKQILEKLDGIVSAVISLKPREQLQLKHTLWNCTQVAEHIGVTYKYANEYIVSHHSFPVAVRLPTKNGKQGHPRWYAQEVIDWVAKNRE